MLCEVKGVGMHIFLSIYSYTNQRTSIYLQQFSVSKHFLKLCTLKLDH